MTLIFQTAWLAAGRFHPVFTLSDGSANGLASCSLVVLVRLGFLAPTFAGLDAFSRVFTLGFSS
jgi:hypothetical protein